MKRVIFANRFFFPDHSATSQILGDLAFDLSAGGVDVHVITSRQLYDDPKAQLPATDKIKGVEIHRVATTQYGRSALVGRGVDYLSFYRSVSRSLNSLARPGDIVVAMTDPPLLSLVAMRAARRQRAHLLNWIQDLYPETAGQLGVPLFSGRVGQSLSYLRDKSLHTAAANVVVGNLMAERLVTRGVPPSLLHVIHNWVDDEEISPLPHRENPLRRQWGLEDKFVLGYSGNLGRAHEFETLLGAAERLRENPDIVFLFVGAGHGLDQLIARVKGAGLQANFRFMPYQERTNLKYSLNVPDVHWLSLRPELEGLIVPSKFYGIAAAGRPVIAVTVAEGEIGRLVRKYECGLVVTPGHPDVLVGAIESLSRNADSRAAMGARGQAMLQKHFSRRRALMLWRNLVEEIR